MLLSFTRMLLITALLSLLCCHCSIVTALLNCSFVTALLFLLCSHCSVVAAQDLATVTALAEQPHCCLRFVLTLLQSAHMQSCPSYMYSTATFAAADAAVQV